MEIPCDYIFKKGTKKGIKCKNINCKIHVNNVYLKSSLPTKIVEKSDNQNSIIKADTISASFVKKVLTSIPTEQFSLETKILILDTTTENKSVIIKHAKVLKKLDFTSSEYYKNQLFIDNALNVPWNKYYNISEKYNDEKDIESFLKNIKAEFDKEIYGMENIKNEIINYVCKLITNPANKKNSLALYGNAGVCKTKFIKVLSKVLNIPLKVISLGGVKDSSYFLGHNFTYVESNYGAIMGGIIDSKIMNPIL
jgi:ATP-dependent Lon protease